MADALRAGHKVPGFVEAADILLVEAAPQLRDVQAQTLAGHRPRWQDDLSDLPDQPLYLLANEFFDALPLRQFIRHGIGWRERQIGVQDGALIWGLAPAQPQPALAARLQDTQDGDLIEVCDAALPIVSTLSRHIARHGGAAIIIDYGDWCTLGDTLQALRHHQPTDPLTGPGTADLTAHVDFEALAKACAPAVYSRVTPQGVFLERLGITARAQALAKGMTGSALDTHIAAHRRLTHPEEMGNLFKVMGITPPDMPPPAGLLP